MSQESLRPICRLKGHDSAVLCCAAGPEASLAAGTEDGVVGIHDLRSHQLVHRLSLAADGPLAVPSIVHHADEPHSLYAAAGTCVHQLDLRQGAVLQRYEVNSDEVNSIALSVSGQFLAAADDSGEVKVIDVRERALHRTLRGGHDNIASGVAFRPHRPWEVLSASLDASLIRWNFATGRPLRRWDMGAQEEGSQGAQAFNPPLVHAVAVAAPDWVPRQLGRLAAVARGDGVVAVYDAAQERQAVAPKKKTVPKGKTADLHRGRGGCEDDDGLPSSERQQGRQEAGCVASLAQETGGHRASVGALAFHQASGGRLILSGGNDARVLLWDWSSGLPDSSPWQLQPESSGTPQTALTCIEHGRKVNAVASAASGALNTFVADTSQSGAIKVYNIT